MAKLAIPKHWPIKERDSYWPIGKIQPYDKNPRTHPPAQVTLLAGLIKSFGPDQHIVVDEDAIILKGHGRRLAAIEAEMGWFPVVQRFGLSEDDKRAMRIADNQVTLLAGWDRTLIYGEVMSLKGSGYDVSLLGFGEAQLVQFTTTPGPPAQFATFGEEIETHFECPSCHYKWSGKPTPDPDGDRPAAKKKPAPKKKKK
jgi:hypothetical protein